MIMISTKRRRKLDGTRITEKNRNVFRSTRRGVVLSLPLPTPASRIICALHFFYQTASILCVIINITAAGLHLLLCYNIIYCPRDCLSHASSFRKFKLVIRILCF